MSLVTLFLLLPLLLLLALFGRPTALPAPLPDAFPWSRNSNSAGGYSKACATTMKIKDSGPDFELVRDLGARLTRGSRFRYEFHVADNPAINAFAMPGGVVSWCIPASSRRPGDPKNLPACWRMKCSTSSCGTA